MRGRPISGSPLPVLVSHRGNAEEFPENTLASIRSAIEHGARHVEFDVQMTADGVPVVHHDGDLKRTAGRAGSIMDLRVSDLEDVDVGEAARFGAQFEGTRIPLLAEVVDLLTAHPEVSAFVEIKGESLFRFGEEVFVPRIVETIEPIDGRAVILSFEKEAFGRVRRRFPIGWVLRRWHRDVLEEAQALNPDYLVINHRKIPPRRRLWEGDWRWILYEVGDPAKAPALGRRGADFIETRAVARFAEHPLYREALRGPV